MKKSNNFLLVLILISNFYLFSFCNNKNTPNPNFVISGQIQNYDSKFVYLYKIQNNNICNLDSCWVENGRFIFNGNLEMPELYYLSDDNFQNYIPIFIENAEMAFFATTFYTDKIELIGSESHQKFMEFQDNILVYDLKIKNLKNQYNILDTTNFNNLDTNLLAAQIERIEFIKNYVTKNNNSNVSAYIVYKILLHEINILEIKQILTKFDENLNNSYYIKQINNYNLNK